MDDRKRIFIGLGGVGLVPILEITLIAAGVLVAALECISRS